VANQISVISSATVNWIHLVGPGTTFQSTNQIWGTSLQCMFRLRDSVRTSFWFWTGMLFQDQQKSINILILAWQNPLSAH